MPRIARLCAVGYPHHITQRGNNKQTVFFDDNDRHFYLVILQRYKNKYGLDIWAYCLMENHVHILAIPKREESLSRGIGCTNLLYTQYINRKYKRSGRLWQNRFFSTIIEKESYLWAVARYIETNPVRANLVKKPEDYTWSSAKAHVLRIKDELVSEESWLNENEFKSYTEFLMQKADVSNKSIRRATSTGRPIGSEEFMKSLEKMLGSDVFPKTVGRPKKDK